MKNSKLFEKAVESVKKVDGMKLLGIGGTILGLAASMMSNASEKKELDKTIEKKVKEALKNQNGGVS